MDRREKLQPVREKSWLRGFRNLLHHENTRWWGTNRWWIQTLIWLILINVSLGVVLWIVPIKYPEAVGGLTKNLEIFMKTMGWWPMFAVIVITQGSMIEEKQSGTAAWVLSGPVSRASFILSKLISNAIGFFITIILIQGIIAYLQISLSESRFLAITPFAAALGIHGLYLLFYLTLTLMLGTFFNSSGPVLGGAISVAIVSLMRLGQSFGGVVEEVLHFVPEMLPVMAHRIIQEVMMPENWFTPLISVSVFCVVFVALAIWRFEKEEF